MKLPDILQLIPQRPPILMVDCLEEAQPDCVVGSLCVQPDNYFMEEDGRMAEVGLIEHMAQTASALMGHRAWQAGATAPPVGFIGEVKNFRCHRRPRVGEKLHTRIEVLMEMDDILLVSAETKVDGTPVADTRLKLSIN